MIEKDIFLLSGQALREMQLPSLSSVTKEDWNTFNQIISKQVSATMSVYFEEINDTIQAINKAIISKEMKSSNQQLLEQWVILILKQIKNLSPPEERCTFMLCFAIHNHLPTLTSYLLDNNLGICNYTEKLFLLNSPYLPPHIKQILSNTLSSRFHVLSLWAETIRHHYNEVFDYNSSAQYENFLGIIISAQLAKMYEDFSYKIAEDSTKITFNQSNRLGQILEQGRKAIAFYGSMPTFFKIYSDKHIELSNDQDRVNHLIKWFEKNPKTTTTILVDYEKIKNRDTLTVLFLFIGSHFVNIQNFECIEKNVYFDCLTYGKKEKITMTLEQFKSCYLGGLFAEQNNPPEKEATLKDTIGKRFRD